jgi:hypothetical protein
MELLLSAPGHHKLGRFQNGPVPSTKASILEEYMNVRQKKQEMLAAMHRARALEPSTFVPNKLLDTLIEKLHLKNDAELCRVLEVQPPIISKIRHRKLNVGATILLRMHEKSNIPIRELKELTSAALH